MREWITRHSAKKSTPSIGQRTATQGFGSSNTLDQKYALTERDKATGLDHTWFRKHENQAGRWTSSRSV